MDILILNWKDVKNPAAGGAEIIIFEFARRLVKEGNTVTFFARGFPKGASEEVIDGVQVVRRGGILSVYLQAFLYYRSLKKKPDKVIDCINTIAWQTPLYVPKKNRIAYLNQLAKEVSFYELSFPLSWIGYICEPFEYIPYKNTQFVCYSRSTKEDLSSFGFGINKQHIKLFSLGVDHARYVPGRKAKRPTFIFVARLVSMKRPVLCIEAMRLVLEDYPEAVLYIVGNGPLEQPIQEAIEAKGLEKNIVLVNKNNFFIKKDKKDVKVKLMQEAWCLLLPSVKEGWGMVVTEAAACGTPAIVSDVTGLRDSVVKNKTGFIISSKPSAQELVKAMKRIIGNRTLRNAFSKDAIRWSKKFTWDKSYEEFKRLVIG